MLCSRTADSRVCFPNQEVSWTSFVVRMVSGTDGCVQKMGGEGDDAGVR